MPFIRKTRFGEQVEIALPRAIQLAPAPLPQTLIQRRPLKGKNPSRKMQQMVGWSDPLERDFLLHLEFDPAVRAYSFRPAAGEIVINLHQKRRAFFPSYQVTYATGETDFAVTCTEVQLAHPDHPFLCEAISARYQMRGYRLAIITDAIVHRSPRFQNLEKLDDCAIVAFHEPLRSAVQDRIRRDGPCTLGVLQEAFGGGERVMRQLLAMVATGHFALCLDIPITDVSILAIPE